MNSRNKGKVGEREFASLLRDNGFDARRGQQLASQARLNMGAPNFDVTSRPEVSGSEECHE